MDGAELFDGDVGDSHFDFPRSFLVGIAVGDEIGEGLREFSESVPRNLHADASSPDLSRTNRPITSNTLSIVLRQCSMNSSDM